ncbi:MAG: translation initiation factor IF-2 [Gemmatimonadetes bacterium]|nr:translation initiation factor IF-2 [Gemmatimonadota bacterium]
MQVIDLAQDLNVAPEGLVVLLRELGIPVAGAKTEVTEADVSRILARIERERRAGHKEVSEALNAAIEDAQAAHRPRRRRRRVAKKEPEVSVEEDAADEENDQESAEGSPEDEDVVATADDDGVDDAPDEAPEASDQEPAEESESAELEPEVDDPAAEAEEESAEGDELAEAGWEEEADEGDPEGDQEEAAEAELTSEAEEGLDPADSAPKPEPVRRSGPEGPARVIRKPVSSPAASAAPTGQVRIQAEGYTQDGRRKSKKDKKGKKRQRVDQEAVQSNIQRVMAELKGSGGKKRKRGKGSVPTKEEIEAQEEEVRQEEERERTTVRVNEFLTVAELAELIDISSTEIIGSAFKNMGLMVTINQRLDFDQIELLLEEFGFTAVRETEYAAEEVTMMEEDDEGDLKHRPPVVTVMGHVDHGKTKLLDQIRSANVVAGEAGGITQHIGAYHVELADGRALTFLDTPGHAAFTAMRARGADVTDIVVLMVAADDSVMPQTVEAISHARNAGVPMVVAVNKVDLPTANPSKVKQELLQHDITVEEFGGDVLDAEISAKQGTGIDDLMEKILLQAEMLELQANPDRDAYGAVIEARLDVGKGPVITVLVQNGTLKVGDSFICGLYDGRVRAMLDERGKPVEEAGPGIPVQVLGAAGVPQAGEAFAVRSPEMAAEIAGNRQRLEREKQLRIKERGFKLGDFSQLLAAGEVSTLPLIIKGDVDGSVQALSDSLEQLGTDEVKVEIIHRAVGAINESDVILAGPASAVIMGFRVRPDSNARQLAEREGVDVHVFDVIYEAVDQVRAALEGMLAPERREKIVGSAEVRDIFKIQKVGTIAGCYVTEGVIERKAKARLVRDGIVVYDGEFSSLKRFKDDVKEVRESFECGIGIANFNDVKIGDVIECYQVEEVARTLS